MRSPNFRTLLAVILVQGILVAEVEAQARRIRTIATPQVQEIIVDESEAVSNFVPVSRGMVTSAVETVVQDWNDRNLEPVLSDQFFDRERLKQAMDIRVPRDASLRILAVQDIQTLRQYTEVGNNGGLGNIVSVVSATVQTQIEYNTGEGFVRLPGTNEFIMEIRTPE